ncbi:CvpA family protein [Bartonella sp. TP]|uniref:CvpA family protein n=1 Tax=Bartonella sp. TP TaxID=3057550 RepID=UPI0025B1195D|nr:CvpA family protein [Bartonella sp. TP]MDN5249170.1 CvpA family protein [Alphaproteobacteria bacterium]WJW80131.1 CvpA family protein [Bartonella sp. TP]
MTIFDIITIAFSIISGIIAMLRGFSREVLSLLSWILSAYLAYKLHPILIPILENLTSSHNLQKIIGLATIFCISLIIISFLTLKISDLILTSFIGPLDRFLGLVYGVARAVIIMALSSLLISNIFEPQKQPAWFVSAKTYPLLYKMGQSIYGAIPPDLLNLDQIFALIKQKVSETAKDAP